MINSESNLTPSTRVAGEFYSIIIPVKSINTYLRETVTHILSLENPNWELIILPNEHERCEWNDPRIRIECSGNVGPAVKRDLGARLARGSYLVFFDDDSYPNGDYLRIADRYLFNKDIVALGGPGITPREDTFWQKVSGAVFLSPFSGGGPERYVSYGIARFVDDWPSVNLVVHRDTFLKIGGFDSPYWPGEDTIFCLKLLERVQKKILYVPELIVWHHRRKTMGEHLKQVREYGRHRGYFSRTYGGNSFKFKYFIPSLFVLSILTSLVLFSLDYAWPLFVLLMSYAITLSLAAYGIRRYEPTLVTATSIALYVPLTHISYGIFFFIGFFTRSLRSRLR